jgi:magnesium transporter
MSTPILSRASTPDQVLTPVGFVLSPDRLVTVRFAPIRVFDGVAAEAEAAESLLAPTVFVQLIEAVVDRGADLLEEAAASLEDVSRAIFRGDASDPAHPVRSNDIMRRTLGRVGQIGDRLSEIRASLLGVGRIVPFCDLAAWMPKDLQKRLKAVRQDISSLDDFEAHLANKVQFLLDAVLGFINTQQNELFKLLTIVSVVGVPPTLVASIYGMNFRNMPELNWPFGYPFALLVIVISTILPLLWFKWKRWL